jgi:hypothetical protein
LFSEFKHCSGVTASTVSSNYWIKVDLEQDMQRLFTLMCGFSKSLNQFGSINTVHNISPGRHTLGLVCLQLTNGMPDEVNISQLLMLHLGFLITVLPYLRNAKPGQ